MMMKEKRGQVITFNSHRVKSTGNIELRYTNHRFVAECKTVNEVYESCPFALETRLQVLIRILKIALRLPLVEVFNTKERAGETLWIAYLSIVVLIEKDAKVFKPLVLSKGYIKGMLRIAFLISQPITLNGTILVSPLKSFFGAIAERLRKYRQILSDYQREKLDENTMYFIGHDCYSGDFFIRPNKLASYGLDEYMTTPADGPIHMTKHATVEGDREAPLFLCYSMTVNKEYSYNVDEIKARELGYSRNMLIAHTYENNISDLRSRFPKKYNRALGRPTSELFFDRQFMAWFEGNKNSMIERGKVAYNPANGTLPPNFLFSNSPSSLSDYAHVAFAIPNGLFLNFIEILDAVVLVNTLQ